MKISFVDNKLSLSLSLARSLARSLENIDIHSDFYSCSVLVCCDIYSGSMFYDDLPRRRPPPAFASNDLSQPSYQGALSCKRV
jgi:hypothetical protein